MASEDDESSFIHVVKNEYALFAYRFVTGACCLIMTWWVLDLKIATQEIRKDFNASLLASESRISKLEGTVSMLDNSIRMQTRSLEAHENRLQILWSRLFDMQQRSVPKGTP